jgi:holo-[acyl-carrier protein] synthase
VAPGYVVNGTGNLLGLGIDAVDINRFASLLARRPAMAERLFSPGERDWALRLANPSPSLAARFAAKEAVMKALGVGLGAFAFPEVEVVRRPSGQPELALTGRAAALAAERGVGHWHVSMTHTDTLASAVVAALS